uniref:Uncharacterized protein n=1 Tax=Anguilla anguilla TaxID=7936 RepID=A0A0E9WSE7_ANGAN
MASRRQHKLAIERTFFSTTTQETRRARLASALCFSKIFFLMRCSLTHLLHALLVQCIFHKKFDWVVYIFM